jgi:hypothetical protein
VERVGDDEDVHRPQGVRRQRLAESADAVAVAPQEFGERLVPPVCGVEVVVGLVDGDAGALARVVGRSGQGRLVREVGHLLGGAGVRGRG